MFSEKPNTYPDVAKNQHLVPRTYMRNWSQNQDDSVLVYDKNRPEKGLRPRNVDTINYITGYHDMKAGDTYVTGNALQELFKGFDAYSIEIEGKLLLTPEDYNNEFWCFDDWIIKNNEGEIISKKERNIMKQFVSQSRFPLIEKEWDTQFESKWNDFINTIEQKCRCKVFREAYHFSEEERRKVLEYILVFEYRSKDGSAWISSLLEDIIPEELGEIDIPKNERSHLFNTNAREELIYADRIKDYYDYLIDRKGKIATNLDMYLKRMGIKVCLAPLGESFITSDKPSNVITRFDGLKEHIFVATPTMMFSLFLTDKKDHFISCHLKRKEMRSYNKYIAKNAEIIITRNEDINIHKLLSN